MSCRVPVSRFPIGSILHFLSDVGISQSPDDEWWHDEFEQPGRADGLHELIQLHWGTSVALMFGDASGDLGLAVLHLRPVVEYQAR